MGGQQPDFLAQIAAGKGRGSGGDPKSKKRKTTEIEKSLLKTPGRKDLTIDTTQKNAFVIPQAVDIPHSPPPPLPPPTSRVPRPILWEAGIVSALSTLIRAPDHFCDPYFSEATIQELKTIEFNTLKASSLIESLVSMQSRYRKALDELHVCHEEKNKTYEDLLKVKEDYKRTNFELLKLQQTHAFNVKSLSDFKVIHENVERKLKEKEYALKESLSTIETLQKEKKEAEVDAVRSRDGLKVGVKGSFKNALDQIKLLNLGLERDVSGAHYMSYVNDGQILPLSPVSPTADSVTQVDGEGDRATNVDNTVDSHVEGCLKVRNAGFSL